MLFFSSDILVSTYNGFDIQWLSQFACTGDYFIIMEYPPYPTIQYSIKYASVINLSHTVVSFPLLVCLDNSCRKLQRFYRSTSIHFQYPRHNCTYINILDTFRLHTSSCSPFNVSVLYLTTQFSYFYVKETSIEDHSRRWSVGYYDFTNRLFWIINLTFSNLFLLTHGFFLKDRHICFSHCL